MEGPQKLGLALSGGGFRAAAFHLGVLKRLREVKLLENVKVLSTVSGGSITGASWLYDRSKTNDHKDCDAAWSEFEESFIKWMHKGVRNRIFWRAFVEFYVVSVIVIVAALGILAFIYGEMLTLKWFIIVIICGGCFGVLIAYIRWHYYATQWLVHQYCTRFEEKPIDQLRCKPLIIINATSLNNGGRVTFSQRPVKQIVHKAIEQFFGRQVDRHIPIAPKTSIAEAVAASSAIPMVFSPLRAKWALDGTLLDQLIEVEPYTVVDGGVYDNQGILALLHESCDHIIVSDAAATLKKEAEPSTWQLLPYKEGKGVFFRSYDIIFERVRYLGYQLLERYCDLFNLFDALKDQPPTEKIAHFRKHAFLKGYTCISLSSAIVHGETETTPSALPESVAKLVGSIRTDLDRFSWIEISALMFHGYTLIDNRLRQSKLSSDAAGRLQLKTKIQHINIDWAGIKDEKRVNDYANHLCASNSRLWLLRIIRRNKGRSVAVAAGVIWLAGVFFMYRTGLK
jgi:NTE family protein